jgi:uncharacterized protein (DUF1800 family)
MPEESRAAPPPSGPAGAARPAGDPERAWAPYEPSPSCPWTRARAAHLLRRAGFGATWEELQRALRDGPQRTVDRLLRPDADVASFNRAYDKDEEAVAASGSAATLRAWWLRRMLETPHPLLEKLALFWHDFFAVSADRVHATPLVRRHVQLLRSNTLGPFPALLAGISRDPATLLALGAEANRKGRPEEGFARQFLHRYTVGPAACSDRDVREAARALTGWFVLRGELRYFEREHDDGEKTILGRTGPFKDEDVVRIAAGHPAAARNVVRRLFRWFVSEAVEPDDALLAPLVRAFAEDGDVARVVGTMLRSNRFFSNASIRRRVKRPVEFTLGLVRGLEGTVPASRLAEDLASLGEDLFHPPAVDGWEGGRHWINRAALIGRSNVAAALLAPSGPYGNTLDPAAVARRHGRAEPEAAGRFLVDLWLQPAPEDRTFEALWKEFPAGVGPADRLRPFAHRIAALPEFQLA